MQREIRFTLMLLIGVQGATCAVNRKALVEKYSNVTQTRFEGAVAVVLQQEAKSTVDDQGESMIREGFTRTKILDRRAMDCSGPEEDSPNCRIVRSRCYDETWDKVELLEARTITPTGEVIELGENDFKDRSWTTWAIPDQSQRCFVYQMKGITQGAIIEERYRIRSDKIIGVGGFWFGDRDPVLEAKYTLNTPESYKYKWKLKNFDTKPIEKRVDGRIIRTWSANQIPQIYMEDGMVSPDDVVAQLKIANENISAFGDYKTCYSITTWEDMGNCWQEMIAKQQEATPIIKEIADNIRKSAKTDTEKIKAVWKYMNENIRYVAFARGLAGYIPLSAQVVCSKKYGDCKAVAGLISVLCRELGVRADPILIGTRPQLGQVDIDLPGPFHFNHSIARVEADGKVYFMDATGRDASFDTTLKQNQGVHVVVARPGAPFLDFVPVQDPKVNSFRKKVVFSPNTDKSMKIKFSSQLKGNFASSYRSYSHSFAGDKFAQYLSSAAAYTYPQMKNVKIKYKGKDNNEKPFEIELEGVLPRALQAAGKNLTFEVKDFFWPYKLVSYFKVPKRHYALDLGQTALRQTRFEIEIPKGMQPVGLPKNVFQEDDFFAFQRMAQIENNRIVTEYTSIIKQLQIPADKYPKARKAFHKMLNSSSFVLMFEPKKNRKRS